MRTSVATVSLSGTLEEKVEACAAAGFDGIEVMDMDVVSSHLTPRAIGDFIRSFGLSVELFQPVRDVEGVEPAAFQRNMRRFERKAEVAAELGAPGLLLCSNVTTAIVSDDDVVAEQLHALGDVAARNGIFVAYEALAWGKHVSRYEHAWRLAAMADHPAVGTCLDSFHILSVGDDLGAIATLPSDRLFFCQIADARGLALDPLTRSRHHRLFPGQGVFDLVSFVHAVQRTGYRGLYSLEIFNDIFRQTDPRTTAVDGLRSLRYLQRSASVPAVSQIEATGIDAVSIASTFPPLVESLLELTGFTLRSRPAERESLWGQGDARIIVTETVRGAYDLPSISGLALRVPDAAAAMRAADDLLSNGEEGFAPTLVAPDGTELRFVSANGPDSRAEIDVAPLGITCVDHVSLTQTWDRFDESVLYYRAIAGLRPLSPVDVADPRGLILSQVLENETGSIRLVLTVDPSGWHPGETAVPPTHLGLQVSDIFNAANALLARGVRLLQMPDNYYEDLSARFEIRPAEIDRLRRHHILYDEDTAGGRYWQVFTRAHGDFFLELVQRDGGYQGYGASNSPVRRATQQAD